MHLGAQGELDWAGAHAPGEPAPAPLPDGVKRPKCVEAALAAARFEAKGKARAITVTLEKNATERAPKGFKRAAVVETPSKDAAPSEAAPVEL